MCCGAKYCEFKTLILCSHFGRFHTVCSEGEDDDDDDDDDDRKWIDYDDMVVWGFSLEPLN